MKDKQKKNDNLKSVGIILLIIGLLLIFIVAISGSNSFSLNVEVINTPSIFKYQENQGREYQEFYKEYDKFINEIDSFNLDELKESEFKEKDDYYTYSNSNYNYEAGSNYIKLIKDGKDIYNNIIEDDVQIITLNSEKEYELEISSSLITFSVSDILYKFKVLEDSYKMEVGYFVGVYTAYEELYDKDFNFKGIKAKYNDVNYEGYLVKDIDGYTLNKDKSMFCKDNSDECDLSTKYLENSEIIYYTLVEYYFNSSLKDNMLLVKEGELFPFH